MKEQLAEAGRMVARRYSHAVIADQYYCFLSSLGRQNRE
jgi:hypothetical protein